MRTKDSTNLVEDIVDTETIRIILSKPIQFFLYNSEFCHVKGATL